jgi:hypothetical protein
LFFSENVLCEAIFSFSRGKKVLIFFLEKFFQVSNTKLAPGIR